MATYIQKGDVIDYTNGTAAKINAGDIVAIGNRIGIAGTDIAVGAVGTLVLEGVFEIPKATGAITVGAELYLDGDGKATATKGQLTTVIGIAVTAAVSADETVKAKLG